MARVSGGPPAPQGISNAQVLYREGTRLVPSLYNTCVLCLPGSAGSLPGSASKRRRERTARKANNAMASSIVPNTIQCDIVYILHGSRVENVVNVQVPGGVDAAVLQDTANEVGGWVLSTLLPLLSNNVQFLMVEAKNLSILSGGVAVYNAPSSSFGGVGDGSAPNNVSYCISLRTARSGRSYRGRFYVAGVPKNKLTGDTVEANWTSDLLAALNGLISLLAALDKLLVVVSRIQDHIVLGVAVATPVETASVTDFVVDSQRRRLFGRGT